MAASNYATGEMLDRFHFSARAVTVGMGVLFLIPALLWFITERWWDTGAGGERTDEPSGSSERVEV